MTAAAAGALDEALTQFGFERQLRHSTPRRRAKKVPGTLRALRGVSDMTRKASQVFFQFIGHAPCNEAADPGLVFCASLRAEEIVAVRRPAPDLSCGLRGATPPPT